MGVLGLMVALSQIDFVLIRLLADLVVNTYTNLKFMQGKTYDPAKYYNLDAEREAREMQSFSITEDELEDCG
jgi:hypothetical protein